MRRAIKVSREFEVAREQADQHLRDNAPLVDQLKSGDPQALRTLLDGYQGTRLKR